MTIRDFDLIDMLNALPASDRRDLLECLSLTSLEQVVVEHLFDTLRASLSLLRPDDGEAAK